MKKLLLTLALASATIAASAHQLRSTHYHDRETGRVVIGNTIAPKVVTTYETDRWNRRIRVVETTRCTDYRVNPRNRHLRCMEEDVTTERFIERRPDMDSPRIEPVIYRTVERDNQGRRVIVITTFNCVRSGYNYREPVCYEWRREEERQYVRRPRGDRGLDLNGDGRTEAWEQVLFQGFREILEDN